MLIVNWFRLDCVGSGISKLTLRINLNSYLEDGDSDGEVCVIRSFIIYVIRMRYAYVYYHKIIYEFFECFVSDKRASIERPVFHLSFI